MVVRKDYLRADKVYQDELLKKDNVEIFYDTVVEKIVEKDGVINKIFTNNGELLINGLFINIGYEPVNDFYKNLNITDETGFIKVDKNMKTNIDGVFAAGDIVKKDVYQIITAQSEGAIAAISAYEYLNYKK